MASRNWVTRFAEGLVSEEPCKVYQVLAHFDAVPTEPTILRNGVNAYGMPTVFIRPTGAGTAELTFAEPVPFSEGLYVELGKECDWVFILFEALGHD